MKKMAGKRRTPPLRETLVSRTPRRQFCTHAPKPDTYMGRTFGAAYAGVGVPYEIRTPVTAVKEERFRNSKKLRGLDSTLPHLKDSRELILDV